MKNFARVLVLVIGLVCVMVSIKKLTATSAQQHAPVSLVAPTSQSSVSNDLGCSAGQEEFPDAYCANTLCPSHGQIADYIVCTANGTWNCTCSAPVASPTDGVWHTYSLSHIATGSRVVMLEDGQSAACREGHFLPESGPGTYTCTTNHELRSFNFRINFTKPSGYHKAA